MWIEKDENQWENPDFVSFWLKLKKTKNKEYRNKQGVERINFIGLFNSLALAIDELSLRNSAMEIAYFYGKLVTPNMVRSATGATYP